MQPHEQSEELKALLANQKVTPRWIVLLRRAWYRLSGKWTASNAKTNNEINLLNLVGHSCTVLIWLLKVIRIAVYVFIAYLAYAFLSGCSVHAGVPSDRLVDALVQVESSGNPNAIGDQGRAYGCLQIWSAVVCDVNQVSTVKYTHADAFDPAKARAICKAYLARYCTAKRLGRIPTDEDYARCWNGGPMGFKKKETIKYWIKVSLLLK